MILGQSDRKLGEDDYEYDYTESDVTIRTMSTAALFGFSYRTRRL